MNIYSWLSSVWRNHPRHASTFSQCSCDRGPRRGDEPCLRCLCDKIVATGKVTSDTVQKFYTMVSEIVKIEQEIAVKIGEDTEL